MGIKHLSLKTVAISYLIFFIGWTLRVFLLDLSGMNELMSWAAGFLIHILWWPVFAAFLIGKYSKDLNISPSEMLTTKPKLKILIPLLLLAIVYNGIAFLTDSSSFGTKMKLYDLIITALTVGIFEESVFRGWFLNAISSFTSEIKANLVSSALFVLIHYPGWIHKGYNIDVIVSASILMYFLSLAFGWAFRKNRSIWTGAIFHSVWDLITWIL